ncbi:MAG: hypothetical protein GF416_09225 [Candidatus Altiarchaeales archaeon]|nr:hypothetical protein [Candidatus Altiarchaeales archaeon]MBD3417300.1 hypothetical protein [Candidatus Altiarchaeales archaeon]
MKVTRRQFLESVAAASAGLAGVEALAEKPPDGSRTPEPKEAGREADVTGKVLAEFLDPDHMASVSRDDALKSVFEITGTANIAGRDTRVSAGKAVNVGGGLFLTAAHVLEGRGLNSVQIAPREETLKHQLGSSSIEVIASNPKTGVALARAADSKWSRALRDSAAFSLAAKPLESGTPVSRFEISTGMRLVCRGGKCRLMPAEGVGALGGNSALPAGKGSVEEQGTTIEYNVERVDSISPEGTPVHYRPEAHGMSTLVAAVEGQNGNPIFKRNKDGSYSFAGVQVLSHRPFKTPLDVEDEKLRLTTVLYANSSAVRELVEGVRAR